MKKDLALIIPVLSQFELFASAIASIDYPVQPYIIKNWNNNIGVAAGWNEGMRRSMKDGYRYALIINDDVMFAPGAIKTIYNDLINLDAVMVSPNFIIPKNSSDPHFPRRGIIESVHWSCFVVDMYKLVQNCGWFDENFYPAYFEDNDMFYRINLAGGLRHYLNTDVVFFHKESATTRTIVTQHDWDYCINYYKNKWGGEPGSERFSTPFDNPNNAIDYWGKRNA